MSEILDVVIIGGGPAGLSAGLYGSRAKLDTLVIEKSKYGGQAATTAELENYPGSEHEATGPSISERMREQAEGFGTKFVKDEAVGLDVTGNIKIVKCKNGEYKAKTIIIATGAEPKIAGFKGEMEFRGRGISYCATCDADFFTDLDIALVGGGDSALTEALYLTKFVNKLTIIHRRDEFRGAKSIQEKVFANPKIEVIWNSVPVEVIGDEIVEGLRIENRNTKEITELEVNGVFVFVGLDPISSVFNGIVDMDERGYIITDADMKTNIPGVFAAGDIRQKTLRQVVTAAADGAIAATSAEKYIYDKFE
ncbi:thioredoxin reductase [Oxobacter pfennigii]|uniref:Thioredoxin reductase n=1 Tax=Oxobacter pfennigii TaxID=36849 RepID=A0A0P8YX60_9CLOT|nr:thioredoxin-disulfide reductase [Oxobacter pfennigii]KPU44307.1 thioredoxin reductase [Oxobacter pfennigii]